ncbi:MAG TPA: hypothetical protein VFA59_24265 [Vicinamibacterales bacterium]|nr:hypothetical protein [Vicinamibacterales bacterium]
MTGFCLSVLVAAVLGAPAIVAQGTPGKPKKPPISTAPWPDDETIATRRAAAEDRALFRDDRPLAFTMTADLSSMNREREVTKSYSGVLTVDGTDIPIVIGPRGHFRLKIQTCDFVPIRLQFAPTANLATTVFDGQSTLRLGTHCRDERESDQYVTREYLAYKLAHLVTPMSFRARLAAVTYVDAKSKKTIGTHRGLLLEREADVAQRLGGREVKVPHMLFDAFDADSLTTMGLVEYMLGNTDFSVWGLHNVIVVQDKRRRFYPVPYDFDLSGLVHAPYATYDPRLPVKSVTDRLYRGPCRTVEQLDAAAAPFRAQQSAMLSTVDASDLDAAHRKEVKSYLESFFRRVATKQAIKSTFVDGCPANRVRI